jgi:hypothetical protein
MNKLLIPLLAAASLLGGCQHVSVRHTVRVPVEVVDHHHVPEDVVIVHQHEGDYRHQQRYEHHDNHERGRVVVVTPRPVIRHREVTVIQRAPYPREQREVVYDRGHHAAAPMPMPHRTPPAASHQWPAHTQPPRGDAVAQPRQVTPLPHALRRLPTTQANGPSSKAPVVHSKGAQPATRSQPDKKGTIRKEPRHAAKPRNGSEDSGSSEAEGDTDRRRGKEQHSRR